MDVNTDSSFGAIGTHTNQCIGCCSSWRWLEIPICTVHHQRCLEYVNRWDQWHWWCAIPFRCITVVRTHGGWCGNHTTVLWLFVDGWTSSTTLNTVVTTNEWTMKHWSDIKLIDLNIKLWDEDARALWGCCVWVMNYESASFDMEI